MNPASPIAAPRRPKRTGPRPEDVVLHQILEALGARTDLTIWRQNTIKARAPSGARVLSNPLGMPDILGVLGGRSGLAGRFVGIEVKSAIGRTSPEQRAMHAMLRRRGALIILARSAAEAVAAIDAASAAISPAADSATSPAGRQP